MRLLDSTSPAVSSGSVAHYTSRELIRPRLTERGQAGIISELSQALHQAGCLGDVLPFYQAALNQELFCSSALDCGIALPHGRLSGIREPRFAFGRTPELVTWGTKGSPSVDLIFLLLVPATDSSHYLHLLSALARLGQNPASLQSLRSANSIDALLRLFGEMHLSVR